jgi:hypothetical protein
MKLGRTIFVVFFYIILLILYGWAWSGITDPDHYFKRSEDDDFD